MTSPLARIFTFLIAFSSLTAMAQQKTIFHYRLNDHHADEVAGGSVPNATTSFGDGTTGDFGTIITLSDDVPVTGVPYGAGNRSINCAGTGGVRANGLQQMLNSDIMAAGGFTFEAWFKFTGGGNVNSIIDYAGTEKLDRPATATGVRMQTNNGIVHLLGDTTIGEWHYAAAVFTATSMSGVTVTGDYTYYLDGIEPVATVTGVTISDFGDSLNRTIGVGMHPRGFTGDFFNGLIYEPRATLKALAPEALLYTPDPVKEAILADSPLAYYRFNHHPVKQPDPDDMRPALRFADASYGSLDITFQFSEDTDLFPGNYQAFENGSGTPLPSPSRSLGALFGNVSLANPMVPGNTYTVRIPGIEDDAGNPAHPSEEASFIYLNDYLHIPDYSGNENHAGFVNDFFFEGIPYRSGANESLTFQSAVFGGDDEHAVIPDLGTGLDAMTFSGWLKIDSDVAAGCCLSLYSPDGFVIGTPHLNLTPGLIGEFSIGGSPVKHLTPGPLPLGKWFHFAVVYDRNAGANGTTEFFLNGQSFGGVQTFSAPPADLILNQGQLGGWNNDPQRNFDGNMDEIAIFGSALTQAQLEAHLASLEGPPAPVITDFFVESSGALSVTFTSEPGVTYRIEGGDDLITWPATITTTATDVTTTLNDLFPASGDRYFLRVIRE